jgi:hypothetical protein
MKKKPTSKPAKRAARRQAQPSKPYWEMTTVELKQATAEFDKEFVADTFGEPTPQQRAQHRRARRKRGRPRVGQGAQTISVSIEKELLAQTDRLARKLKVQRAKLIARGLQAVVNREVTLPT